MNYRILPLPAEYLHRTRFEGVDALDQSVRRSKAQGGEPCRDALRRARPGEDIILASYSPFRMRGPYREFGPVFLLAQPEAQEPDRETLPFEPADPLSYFARQLTLRAYSTREEILDAKIVPGAEAEAQVRLFLAREGVAWVDARFPAYGCFAARFVAA